MPLPNEGLVETLLDPSCPDGMISVESFCIDRFEAALVRVADDGSGVPDELRDRVFTPFYSTRPSGTGLGLAVVKSSAEAHGGEVTLESTPGGGATFTLRLPRRPVSNRPRALERAS
jgi:signal transduction histidine kinase